MNPEFWSIITTGIVILIAIAASNRSLRRELGERISRVERDLGARIDGLSDRLGDVRERLGRIEGLLEGFGLTRRNWAGKGRDDERRDPVPPRS